MKGVGTVALHQLYLTGLLPIAPTMANCLLYQLPNRSSLEREANNAIIFGNLS